MEVRYLSFKATVTRSCLPSQFRSQSLEIRLRQDINKLVSPSPFRTSILLFNYAYKLCIGFTEW